MANSLSTVTIGFDPATSPTEYFYYLHISSSSSSSSPDVSNADAVFVNDTSMSISVTTTHTPSSAINGNGTVGGREFWEQCLIAVVLSSIALAAMIGNVLVIAAVWRYRRLRSVTNCFVVSLALADLLVSILVLPINIFVEVTGQWLFGSIVCDLWVSSDVLLCTSSILNLCCISLDRYFAITRPLIYSTRRNKRLAIFMVAVAWGLAAVITCPPIFGWKEEGRDLADGCSLTRDPGYIIYSSCGSFFIPLLVMLFVYARIYHVASKREKRLRPYWRTFFDGRHQRKQPGSKESTVSKRKCLSSSSADKDNQHEPTPSSLTNACTSPGASGSTISGLAVASGKPFVRDALDDKDTFSCHEKGFLWKFKSSFRRCSKTSPHQYHRRGERAKLETGTPALRGSETKFTNPNEYSDSSSNSNIHTCNSSSSSSKRSSSSSNVYNNKIKSSKNKMRLFSSCYHQSEQSHPQLCQDNGNYNVGNMAAKNAPLTTSMTQASIPLLAPTTSFHDDFNTVDEDESAMTLVDIRNYKENGNDSTFSTSHCGQASSLNSQRKSRTSKSTISRSANHICSGFKPRTLRSSTHNQRPSHVSSAHSTDRGRLKRRLGLNRRRMIPRKYITSLSSRASRFSLRSRRPTLEITPPCSSPGSNRPISTSLATSITATTTITTTCAAAVTNTVRRTDSESTSSRHLDRLLMGPEESSAAEHRRRNRVVERSLYMKERKTAKTLAIVVGCFVVCWLPFFLIYVIDVFCTQCHVTPTLFSALTWLGYFNSALNPLIYALYNTGFRHAFWNLTFGLCFGGERRKTHLLPSVTSYGGRVVTCANLKNTISSGTAVLK